MNVIALHSIRCLLCTATNTKPHERLFNFSRRSGTGYTLPEWLQGGPALLRKFVCQHKSDPLVEPVEIISVTPNFARIRFPDGRQSTVPTEDLAPTPVTVSSFVDSDSPVFTDHCESSSSTPSNNNEPEMSTDQQETTTNGESSTSVGETKSRDLEQQQLSHLEKDALRFLPESSRRGRKIIRNPKYQ